MTFLLNENDIFLLCYFFVCYFQVVRITFDELDIEKDSTCGYDYLKVYDGTSASVRILSTLCGKDIPYPIYSRGRDMYLKFSTDMRVNFKGFSMQIRFTAPPPRRGEH